MPARDRVTQSVCGFHLLLLIRLPSIVRPCFHFNLHAKQYFTGALFQRQKPNSQFVRFFSWIFFSFVLFSHNLIFFFLLLSVTQLFFLFIFVYIFLLILLCLCGHYTIVIYCSSMTFTFAFGCWVLLVVVVVWYCCRCAVVVAGTNKHTAKKGFNLKKNVQCRNRYRE